jgi:Asp-tRNA(Asn)/Glu-tRNA(Gln) amidotransferase A subunit family amidase
VLQAIAGYDPADITAADVPAADYAAALKEGAKALRVGVPRDYFYEDLDPEVAAIVENALHVVRSLVAEMKELRLDVPTDRTLQAAESYAIHAAGVAKSPELYQPETLRRIRSGENVSAAEYIRGHRELDEARRNISAAFREVDLLVTPTTPIPAPGIAELKANPEALRPAELKLLRNTRPFNVWGLPAISIPCGVTRTGLPIGLQIAGPHWREDLVFRLAQAYEELRSSGQPPAVVPTLASR